MTLLLTRDDVRRWLPMEDAIAALDDAYRAQARGGTLPAGVLGVPLPGGGLHVKAAGLRGTRLYVAAKLNANLPENPGRGLPTIQGLVVLFDGDDGRPLAVLDSIEATAIRTAAASALAARALARADADTLALCGCGTQAVYHVRALAAVRPLRTVWAFDIDRGRAERLRAVVAAERGPEVVVMDAWPGQARQAALVVTCTPSRTPLLGAGDVARGACVIGVGADHPAKSELAPALLARSRVFVDSLEQAATIGDLHHALAAGALTRGDVIAELVDLITGAHPGRNAADEVTVFDSTGVALQDVAVAALVYERARAAGAGRVFDFAPPPSAAGVSDPRSDDAVVDWGNGPGKG